jgi:hypothetical protein
VTQETLNKLRPCLALRKGANLVRDPIQVVEDLTVQLLRNDHVIETAVFFEALDSLLVGESFEFTVLLVKDGHRASRPKGDSWNRDREKDRLLSSPK